MALFLTRVLAADGIVQPQSRVAVTPTAAATQATGTARTYTATFKNADGTAYTGRVGIQLVEATDAGAPVYNDVPEQSSSSRCQTVCCRARLGTAATAWLDPMVW